MEALTLQPWITQMVSINITNTSILSRWKYSYYKHEYITQMEVFNIASIHITNNPDASINITNITEVEVLTLQTRALVQTRVYFPDGSINITTEYITQSSINITNTRKY